MCIISFNPQITVKIAGILLSFPRDINKPTLDAKEKKIESYTFNQVKFSLNFLKVCKVEIINS